MSSDPLIGRRLANFEVERTVGRGGMAQVYYGRDVKLNRPVAIKVIDARYRGQVSYAQRFVREAQSIARWRHENIVQIYYADDEDGFYYYVMEYIDGTDLDQMLADYAERGEYIAHSEVLRIGRATASALDYAHRKGIIHRDVKPSNVLVAREGRVVLVDFGLAMDIETGTQGEIFGSAHYIAPEQARNSSNAVPQSDVYSLGVILYRMLAGQVPFDDPSSTTVALQHLTMPPPPPRELNPAITPAIEAVLLKALSKTPEERYQTGKALLDALDSAINTPADVGPDVTQVTPLGAPALTQPSLKPAAPPLQQSPQTQRSWLFAVIGIGGAAILLLLFMLLASFMFSGDDVSDSEVVTTTNEPPTGAIIIGTDSETDSSTETTTVAETEPGDDNSAEALPPTDTPIPATPTPEPRPRVVADTFNDFAPADAADSKWKYLWATPGQNNWQSLRYGQRQYGTCWYGQDYIRICKDSAHPGNSADLAWQWSSDITGTLEINLIAGKLDRGGDGVVLEGFYNSTSNGMSRLFRQTLAGRDTSGINEIFTVEDVVPDDQIVIVMRHNGDATSDHTAFQARLCHVACP